LVFCIYVKSICCLIGTEWVQCYTVKSFQGF
jgi:hypothetical protein